MISNMLKQPCQIIRRSASNDKDAYGNELQTETVVETVCSLQQQQRAEATEDLSDTRWLLVLPAGTVIDTSDAIQVGGLLPGDDVLPSDGLFPTDAHRFELIGEPWPVIDPRSGHEHHVEATVRRTAGSEDTA